MADLAERDRIETVHIVEVIQYRPGSRRRKVLILPAFQLNPSGLIAVSKGIDYPAATFFTRLALRENPQPCAVRSPLRERIEVSGRFSVAATSLSLAQNRMLVPLSSHARAPKHH